MADKVVLVIDDDNDICKTIKEALERLDNFKVITASNGKDGFQMAKRSLPDLVLLDIDMPDMDGFAVLRILKDDAKTFAIPVVMLTGKRDDVSKIAAARLYSEEYLMKPISMLELKKKIDAILARMGK
jgi:DNA-binding response OmpR family regulator